MTRDGATNYGDRSLLTFEQAEGAEPLPTQLALREISPELRALIWSIFVKAIPKESATMGVVPPWVGEPWTSILKDKFVSRDHKLLDEYKSRYDERLQDLKADIVYGDYIAFFGLIEWVVRHRKCPQNVRESISVALRRARAAYRLVDGRSIVPIASDAEGEAIERAFADVARHQQHGARKHLQLAAEACTNGRWAECVTQSAHAVEAVAKSIEPSAKQLKPALDRLNRDGRIHGALQQGFLRIYDYTSDEKGLRHSLSNVDQANVDEADALFMLGACASFVSYLLAKGDAEGRSEKSVG